jgi:dihydroxyacid dehydratase/phosphogluconate dehydratase
MLNAGGVSYALQRLKRTGPSLTGPTQDERKMANYILARLSSRDRTLTLAMANFAVQWGDLAMWKQVVKATAADKSLDIVGQATIFAAWKKFSFETVRPM